MAKNRITFSNELVLRDGKVGIGTSAPNSELSVFGAAEIEGVIKIVSSGTTSGEIIEQKHYRDNGGSIAYQSGDKQLFSVSNETDDLLYVINDDEANSIFSINKSGLGTITALNVKDDVNIGLSLGVGNSVGVSSYIQTPTVNFLSVGSTETSKITAKHYSNNDGSLVLQSGDENLFSVTNERDLYYSINDSEAKPALTVSDLGITTVRDLFQNRVNFTSVGSTDIENIQINHYRNIAYQPAVGSTTNNKGAISFDSPTGISTDGITFFPASLFAISNGGGNIFSVSGYQYFSGSNTLPVIDVTQDGRLGIGTTTPQNDVHLNLPTFVSSNIGIGATIAYVALDVNGNTQFRTRVAFSQTANPSNNASIDITPYTVGVNTYSPVGGALVITSNRSNDGINGSQLWSLENNNNTLFRVNKTGFGLTFVSAVNDSNTTRPINPVIDVTPLGEVRIFDTENPKISGFGYTSVLPGDGDLFRVDSFSSPFIGSFPTVNTAIRITQFGLIEVNRDINQTSGNSIIGSSVATGTTSQPLQVTGGSYISGNVGIGTTSPRSKLDVIGNLNITGVSTVGLSNTSNLTSNSSFTFELTSNTTLTLKVRGSDGIVRSGIITLS